jgi:hypothetical protein
MTVRELREIRRIVTGCDASGRSKVLFDGPPHAGPPAQLWTTTGAPAPISGSEDAALLPMRLDAPKNGTRFWLVRMAPGNGADRAENARKSESLRARGAYTVPGARPDMHFTKTIDYVVVLEGSVVLVLEEVEVTLHQFDCVVQRGTNHCWENRSSEAALLMFVLVDATDDPAESSVEAGV